MAAIFGPESGTTTAHIQVCKYNSYTHNKITYFQSICDALEIPHIETRWDYIVKRDSYSINLHPSPKLLSKVLPLSFSFSLKLYMLGLYEPDPELWLADFHNPLPG